ncbi:MAG: sterol desaturase family protein [Arenicellales bacterium]|jgi:sterol desaturase/sphingolipid hydroxylase (fatty acid hydroxylase superfamily)
MSDLLAQHEAAIRLLCFFSVLAAVMLWQWLRPRRRFSQSLPRRWLNNFGIVIVNTVLLRLAFPAAAVGAAVIAADRALGIFNYLDWPPWLEILISVVALDALIWAQHVVFHKVPMLWRVHRMHHLDLDFDVSTGLRFHPVEILISMGVKWAAVVALGAPALGVLIFEILLNAFPMFNHANAGLPERVDRALRWFVVTPDMHRVHHSVLREETNSNYGFNLSWWDRLFGTYRDQPAAGHVGMSIGQSDWRKPEDCVAIWGMLRVPFHEP